MRDTPMANCEKEFLLSIIKEKKRIDGRKPSDFRQITVSFGLSFGSCEVKIGETRVLAHVSAEVAEPKAQRPNEGLLFINFELSPMAHPSFEQGRQLDEMVELSGLLERSLKESNCVDLESLCIVAVKKVWALRVDITVLNHDGNMLDCACIAAMAALKHFRRPDVTVIGEDVTIHSLEERDPVPLSVHHIPICVTLAFYHEGKSLLIDPNEKEEKIAEGKMFICKNKHREICMQKVTGMTFLKTKETMEYVRMVQVKVMEMTDLIQEALTNDKTARAKGEKCGFAVSADHRKINTLVTPAQLVEATHSANKPEDCKMDSDSDNEGTRNAEQPCNRSVEDTAQAVGPGIAILGATAVQKWKEDDEDDNEDMQEEV